MDKVILTDKQLLVVPERLVSHALRSDDYQLLVSVGYPYNGNQGTAHITVCNSDGYSLSQPEISQSFNLIHEAWRRCKNVLIHCYEGMHRSPAFAWLCAAEYFGINREVEAEEYVRRHCTSYNIEHEVSIINSAVPYLKHDETAVFFIVRNCRTDILGDKFYELIQHRKIVRRGDGYSSIPINPNIEGYIPNDKGGIKQTDKKKFLDKWMHTKEIWEAVDEETREWMKKRGIPEPHASLRELCLRELARS